MDGSAINYSHVFHDLGINFCDDHYYYHYLTSDTHGKQLSIIINFLLCGIQSRGMPLMILWNSWLPWLMESNFD